MKKLWLALFLAFLGLAPAQAVTPATRMYDANLAVSPATVSIGTTVIFTAPRTIQLPSASATLIGQTGAQTYYQYALEITDNIGAISQANFLTIQAAPGETINGQAFLTLNLAYAEIRLIPVSGSAWVTDNRIMQAPTAMGLLPPSVLNSYGADPSGVADSAPAFAAACNANPGATIRVPSGLYFWNSPQVFNHNCTFVGDGWNLRDPSSGPSGQALREGTWIRITNPSIQPITWNAAGSGGFQSIGWEQAQPTPSATLFTPWAPTAYPPLILLTSYGEFHFERDYLYGITNGIVAPGSPNPAGGIVFDHLRGQVYGTLYRSDQNIDLVHADDVTLYPHALQNPNVQDYTEQNAIAFDFRRVDGFESDHLFALGMREMFRFQQGTTAPYAGGPSNIHIGTLYCDACLHGFENTASNASIHIVHLTFGGQDDGSLAAQFAANHGTGLGPVIPQSLAVSENGLSSVVTIDRIDNVISGEGVVNLFNTFGNTVYTIGATYIGNINVDNDGAPAFQIINNSAPSSINLTYPPLILPGLNNNNGAPTGSVVSSPLSYITNVWLPWTPTIRGVNTQGNPTYTTQKGEYLVSGGMVYATCNLNVSSIGGATGTIIVGGLPLNTPATMVTTTGSISTMAGFNLTSGFTNIAVAIPASANTVQLLQNNPGAGTAFITNSNLPGGLILNFEIAFRLL